MYAGPTKIKEMLCGEFCSGDLGSMAYSNLGNKTKSSEDLMKQTLLVFPGGDEAHHCENIQTSRKKTLAISTIVSRRG